MTFPIRHRLSLLIFFHAGMRQRSSNVNLESNCITCCTRCIIGRSYYAMLCYAMLCYAMLCYAMLCYVMLCYALLYYAMLCYAMLCYVMLCYATLCSATLCSAMLCYAMLCYAMLRCAALCYAICTGVRALVVFLNISNNILYTRIMACGS